MKRDSLVVAEGCVLSGDEVGRTRPNANALIVGTTGCGKSTSVILPTVARMHCSNPILSYAKERDAYLMAEYLKRKNCKETIFALENGIFRRKNPPVPTVHAAGHD